ncbi:golgin subfamily A member 6-like protein 22 isoform X2 [Hippoglossus hippoglossus]|uniref:golgin subfamily A member 6-like protein 22 isoform X2 n=1 Tax=Hippoglossus hippoglossus TaxID=8267 RepID=UPI00148BCFF6|nr:golgin subfamily A member 6-like protein 22 isoform X2 [Hippoglossus hippoglossus]
MSQKPESGAARWKRWGHGGDGSSLPCGEAPAPRSPATGTSDVKQLLSEFRGLHEQRLEWLQLDTGCTPEELLQKKEDLLQTYVNDLTDQNQVLVQTIEELQMEADHNLSKSDLNQQRTNLELSDHLRDLRSGMNSITQLLQQTGHLHNLDAEANMESLRSELSASFERRLVEREARVNQLTQELDGVKQKMKERDERVRHLNQDVLGLRATQDSMTRTLAVKEKHTQQLVHGSVQLQETVTSLQSKLQTSECMLRDIGETLDQTTSSLNTERQQKEQNRDQLHHCNEEVERLQQELAHVHRTAEKKMQKREIKIGLLVKELTESKKQHADCQEQLLHREKDLEKLYQEKDELRAKMEEQSRECVRLNQTKERLEADLALSHEKLHGSHLEVRSRDQLILQLRDEMKTAEQKYQATQEQVAELECELKHLNHKVRGHQEEACQLSRKVRDTERHKDQKEKEQQRLHNQIRISQQQVETSEGKLRKQEDEMGLLHQQLKGAKEELNGASSQIQEQNETVAILKQKYAAAIEKVHRVQGQVELLEEELQYSQQQLRESQLETHSVKREQAELEQRYQEKVSQWESSQEALDQLTDELQANQTLLRESQQKGDHFRSLIGSLQEQGDKLKQQKLMLECDLRLHKTSHSHSDEEYLGLQRHSQQLQKRCTEQVERIAECEKAILQMKSELERQTQEKADVTQNLALSHRTHVSICSRLEQEVTRLKTQVTHLELELADTQKVHAALLRQSEEELEEARREAAGGSREVDAQRGEVQRLQEELRKQEEKMRSATREKQSLSAFIRQLSQEVEELRGKHQATVEDLAARAEEVRRMEGCLREGKLAEEKIRSMAVTLETEVAELRTNLQQAVSHKLEAESGRQDSQGQANRLRAELEETLSDNANLRHESQLVMTNVNRWITEQKASSENLTAQMKAQNKLLLMVTKENEHLQEANDTLKVEVKRLKEVADEKESDAKCFKARIREHGIRQDERTMENQTCVALNLSKIEQMQTRLRSNLEAIGMLNQQLNALSGENKRLRRQLEEERSMRRQAQPPPPTPPAQLLRPAPHLPRRPPSSSSLRLPSFTPPSP